jgi:hypothetical protein
LTQLPATVIEAEAVNTVADWIDRVAAALTSETARLVLRKHIRDMLRQGAISTMQVIEAAEAGHEDADIALRELLVEMSDRGEIPGAALRHYGQKALLRAPVTYPPGRNLADTWLRDIGIAVLVTLAVERWQMPATRNRASNRPSACSMVSEALGRRGHNIGERRVEKIFGTRCQIAQKLSASIPPI